MRFKMVLLALAIFLVPVLGVSAQQQDADYEEVIHWEFSTTVNLTGEYAPEVIQQRKKDRDLSDLVHAGLSHVTLAPFKSLEVISWLSSAVDTYDRYEHVHGMIADILLVNDEGEVENNPVAGQDYILICAVKRNGGATPFEITVEELQAGTSGNGITSADSNWAGIVEFMLFSHQQFELILFNEVELSEHHLVIMDEPYAFYRPGRFRVTCGDDTYFGHIYDVE